MHNALQRSKVMQGSARVNRGQTAYRSPIATKFVGRTSDKSVMYRRVKGRAGVSQRSNCLKMPYGYQIW